MSDENSSAARFNDAGFPGVSIVLPILNEERDLAFAIHAILQQEYPGELEVILALGPSKDRTNEIARSLANEDSRVRLVENPSGRTASGLNRAISISRYPIICRIDGHAEVSKNYVQDAVVLLRQTGAVNVGGVMAAEGKTTFQRAVARAMRSPLGVGAARFHVGGEPGPADTVYLGTFQKSALQAVGGYDERFTRAQDWELNFRLRKAGGTIWFDPSLVVLYRPRSTYSALAKQYFEYGRWRRVVARNHKGSINARYLAPPTAVVGFIGSLITGLALSPWLFLPAIGYLLLIALGGVIVGTSVPERLVLPSVFFTMHIFWGLGFLTSPRSLVPDSSGSSTNNSKG